MQRAHTFFNRSPKRLSEFQKLAEVIETKGLRPLQNITTRWISLLEPLRRILSEYCTLIVKMTADQYDYADAKVPQTALFVFLLFFLVFLMDGGIDVVLCGLASCDPAAAGPVCTPWLMYHTVTAGGSGYTVRFHIAKGYFCFRLHCSSKDLRGPALYHVR
jgi:hypothetical protein